MNELLLGVCRVILTVVFCLLALVIAMGPPEEPEEVYDDDDMGNYF